MEQDDPNARPAWRDASTTERCVKDVPSPPAQPLPTEELFLPLEPGADTSLANSAALASSANAGTRSNDPNVVLYAPLDRRINIPRLREHLSQEGKVKKEDFMWIVDRVTEYLTVEPTVIKVKAPLTICGDIHGQYYDLLKLFELGGAPEENTYLFLGDYVDRGSFSLECVLLLYAYKLMYPTRFFMIRGNHECRHLTQYFTFRHETEVKYDVSVYDAIMDSFDALPLAAIVNQQFLCVHGGLSPNIKTIRDIESIDRFGEPPQEGPFCDLLWADPREDFDTNVASPPFQRNTVRGCSYWFSHATTCQFLADNQLLSVIRAHEAQDNGYRMYKKTPTGFPAVITLFSAPNYLDAYNNKGAVLRYENNVMNIRQFNCSPHPYWLPNFMDIFTWSLPFVSEKVAELLLGVLNLCDDEQAEREEEVEKESEHEKEKRRRLLRAKVQSVSKMLRIYKVLRMESESLMLLKSLTPNQKIPQGLLAGGRNAILEAIGNFSKAKAADTENEKWPSEPEDLLRARLQRTGSNSRLHTLRTSKEHRIAEFNRQMDREDAMEQKKQKLHESSDDHPVIRES